MSARSIQPHPWLRSAPFDLVMIGGALALSLLFGGAGLVRPSIFAAVVLADLWLLAYPHVASTYTRVVFDREHRALLFWLPPVVLALTAGAAWLGGAIVVNSVYFGWQTWHYARQSHGIARAYVRDVATECVIYAFPAWGLLRRAAEHPPSFFGAPVWFPPVPAVVVHAAGFFAVGSLAVWTLRRLRSAPPLGHTLFVLSHVVVTVVSYIGVRDVTQGWLFVNVWHNAQYILFVWAFNARRFEGRVDPARALLSRLSQRDNVLWYGLACIGISTAFYAVLGGLTARVAVSSLPLVLVVHQAVNFTHYLVDARIWRRKRA